MNNSEISSQVSRKLEEVRIDLNAHVLEAFKSSIAEKVLPTIENTIINKARVLMQNWTFGQMDHVKVKMADLATRHEYILPLNYIKYDIK